MENNQRLQASDKLHQHFMKCYKGARSIADQWASLLEACFHFAIPSRNRFYRHNEDQGEQRNKRIYDTTAIEATKTFVSKLHTAMTPPQEQWGYLDVTEEYDEKDADLRQQAQLALDMYMKKLFEYIHTSNFDVVINECYFDLAVGTACLVVNQYKDDKPLIFTSIPLEKLAIKESIDGSVNTWFRTWENTRIAEIQSKWHKAQPTPNMISLFQSNPEAVVAKLYEGVLYIPGAAKPFCYGVSDGDQFLFHEYFESNPGIVWRFQKTNAETWGRGPVMDALPSIASLNEMARIELASANLNTFRPYMASSDGVFNPHTFKLQPFSVIPIAPFGATGQPPLIPLPDASSPQFGQLMINDLRMQIKTLLFNDTPSTASIQPGSATEVLQNQEDLAQKIGPLFSRLQQEFLWPVIDRCAYILDKMGILKRPEIDGHFVQFTYRSPLARFRGQQEVAKFAQFMQLAQGMYGPEIANLYVNPMKALYKIADYVQLDPDFLNDPKAIEEAAQDMAAAQQMGPEQQAPEQQLESPPGVQTPQ